MREYGSVSPQFWIGQTGKRLRGNVEAQIVAFYLMTSPHSNMIGVFHCPILYIAHETGLPFEATSKGLKSLMEEGFCQFDEASETVFVVNMAQYQVGSELKSNDNKILGIRKAYLSIAEPCMRKAFHDVYGEAFFLPEWVEKEAKTKAPSKPLRSPFEAPSKPLRSPLDPPSKQLTGTGAGTGTGTGTGTGECAYASSDFEDLREKQKNTDSGFSKNELVAFAALPALAVADPPVPSPDPAHAADEFRSGRRAALMPCPPGFEISDDVRRWARAQGVENLEAHFQNFVLKSESKDYRYANWDKAFKAAVLADWLGSSRRGIDQKGARSRAPPPGDSDGKNWVPPAMRANGAREVSEAKTIVGEVLA
jgi:hypothetical protein